MKEKIINYLEKEVSHAKATPDFDKNFETLVKLISKQKGKDLKVNLGSNEASVSIRITINTIKSNDFILEDTICIDMAKSLRFYFIFGERFITNLKYRGTPYPMIFTSPNDQFNFKPITDSINEVFPDYKYIPYLILMQRDKNCMLWYERIFGICDMDKFKNNGSSYFRPEGSLDFLKELNGNL